MSELIKVVMFFRRKEGLTHEEFKDYYENSHTVLFEKYLELHGIERYVRRYLEPMPDAVTGATRPSGFDAITEVWISDRELFESFRTGNLYPDEFRERIAADEAELFDRESIFFATVEEHDSDLPTNAHTPRTVPSPLGAGSDGPE